MPAQEPGDGLGQLVLGVAVTAAGSLEMEQHQAQQRSPSARMGAATVVSRLSMPSVTWRGWPSPVYW